MLAIRYQAVSVPLLLFTEVFRKVQPAGAVALAGDQYEKKASRRSPFCTPAGTITWSLVVEVAPIRWIVPGMGVCVAVAIGVPTVTVTDAVPTAVLLLLNAVAEIVWLPFATVVVFQLNEVGGVDAK